MQAWTRWSRTSRRGTRAGSHTPGTPEVLPRNVKITLMVLFLFFIGEYILLPELASARESSTS